MKPNFIAIGAFCAARVALGAFGAHALRGRISPSDLGLWETATRYWLVGAFGNVLFGLSATNEAFRTHSRHREPSALPGWLLLLGSTLFALSLYGLALGACRTLGFLTPFGGFGLIAGFVGFALSAHRRC